MEDEEHNVLTDLSESDQECSQDAENVDTEPGPLEPANDDDGSLPRHLCASNDAILAQIPRVACSHSRLVLPLIWLILFSTDTPSDYARYGLTRLAG